MTPGAPETPGAPQVSGYCTSVGVGVRNCGDCEWKQKQGGYEMTLRSRTRDVRRLSEEEEACWFALDLKAGSPLFEKCFRK
ncbi:uncharacterized [Tachysurus ichikawai]